MTLMKRHYISILIICLLVSVTAQAQICDTLFLHFTAKDYPVSPEGLPEVTHIEYLDAATMGRNEDIRVQLLYPEYVDLTATESKTLRRSKFKVSAEPNLEWSIGCFRKQPQLDINFCPIVKVKGKTKRIASAKLIITNAKGDRIEGRSQRKATATRVSENAGRYAAHSVLSSGRWVKIAVNEEGMYEIPAEKLAEWGFSNISNVRLFGYGGNILPEKLEFTGPNALIDDLNEIPLLRRGNSVLFYADGPVRWNYSATGDNYTHTDNYYSSNSCYFLTEGGTPAEITTAPVVSTTAEIETVAGHALYDGNAEMWYEGGRRLFDAHDFATGNNKNYTLNAPSINTSAGTPRFTISISASSPLASTPVSVKVNNRALANLTISKKGSNEDAVVTTQSFNSALFSSSNTLTITTGNANNARLDYLLLNYKRTLDASSNFTFAIGNSAPARARIINADSGTQVWELPHGATPLRRISGTLNGNTYLTEGLSAEVRYAVVNTNRSYPCPTLIGQIANQDLHSLGALDMVIVIPNNGQMAAQAERLAQIHRTHDNLRIGIFTADMIYNEFSSGTPDATAIRRFMKMLYDRAEREEDIPRFLLLMGNSLADNRLLTSKNRGKSTNDYLLCFERDNSNTSIGALHSFCSDDYFGLLDDGEGVNIYNEKVDLGIGRLSCSDAEDAKILVDKIERYLSNADAGTWKSDVLLIGDYGDANGHMEDAERVGKVISESDSRLVIHKVYPDAYNWTTTSTGHSFPQVERKINTLLGSGVALVNYSGHGAPDQLSHAVIVKRSTLETISSRHLPVWLLASCEIYPIDSEEENIAKTSMLKPDGGSIAFICATRAVYASYNNPFNCSAMRYLLGRNDEGKRYTLGEAVMYAKNDMVIKRTDLTMNKLKYILSGDPALVLSIPTGNVTLDKVNEQELDETPINLRAGSVVSLEGHLDTPYDGKISVRIYDREETIVCKNNAKDDLDTPYKFNTREDCVAVGSGVVQNGQFKVNVSIPIDISYSKESGRMVFYTIDDNRSIECAGDYSNFSLNGTDPAVLEDEEAPSVFLYFGDEEFPSGGAIGPEAILEAKISDNYGINSSGNALGHDMSLTIDDNVTNAVSLNDYFEYDFGSYLSGHIAYPLSNLSLGRHVARLRVWDVNNNSAVGELEFIVQRETPAEGIMRITCGQNPIMSATQFVVSLTDNHDGSPVHLELFDGAGQMLWQDVIATTPGQHYVSTQWNVCTSSGAPVSGGLYFLRATQGHNKAQTQKILVRK